MSVKRSIVIGIPLALLVTAAAAIGLRWGRTWNSASPGVAPQSAATETTAVGTTATGTADAGSTPTYSRDIAPLVFAQCAECHHAGGSAPFSLLTYDDLRKRADQAVDLVARRRMPPWPPDDGCGPFVGERRLSDEQIDLLRRWALGGTPLGDPHEMPPVPQFSADWKLGQPDLVVKLPEPFLLPAEGPDVYQNFVMPLRLAERHTVRAVEFRSGNPPVVHHVFFLLDRSGAGRRASREAGWSFGGIHPGDGISSVPGRSLSWRPGSPACLDTSDAPWLLPAGADIVLQAHLRPSGKPEPVQPEIGLYFTDDPPVDSLVNLQVRSTSIDIPAGQRDYEIHDSYIMPVAVEILSVSAHAHYLGTDLQGFATLPDGTRQMLLRIPHWDFGLQGDYVLERGVTLPAGSKLEMSFHYDNSAANPQNPSSPPRRVLYGLNSDDEMGEFWVQLRTPNPADLKILMADYHRRWMIPETIRQHQVMLARNPGDADRHARLGVVLLEAGQKKDGHGRITDRPETRRSLRQGPSLPGKSAVGSG